MFVLYATSSANSVAHSQNRKTITGPDVVAAMSEMELDKFCRPLENSLASKANMYIFAQPYHSIPIKFLFFAVWRSGQQDKKEQAARKKAEKEKAKQKGDQDVIEID